MEIWEAIVLGVLQGLTEFLPVSSSGHLEIANKLFGIHEPNNMLFTVALHAGTVLSTIVVFRKDLAKYIKGFFRFKMTDEMIYVINILISLIPIVVIGLMFKDEIERLFTSNLLLVGIMLLVTAALLTLTQIIKQKSRPITPQRAFIIGLAQAIAVIPGLSRSGATISTGLLLGVKREEVAKFSFLMVMLPVIGMSILEFKDFSMAESSFGTTNIIIGFLSSFIVGLLACKWMVKLVGKGKLMWFAVYCMLAGIGSIILNYI